MDEKMKLKEAEDKRNMWIRELEARDLEDKEVSFLWWGEKVVERD